MNLGGSVKARKHPQMGEVPLAGICVNSATSADVLHGRAIAGNLCAPFEPLGKSDRLNLASQLQKQA